MSLDSVSKAIAPKSSVKVLRTTMSVYLTEEVSSTLLLPRRGNVISVRQVRIASSMEAGEDNNASGAGEVSYTMKPFWDTLPTFLSVMHVQSKVCRHCFFRV